MTREEAQEYAKTMSYSDAIYNLMKAKSIPYRKATFIKITELLKELDQEPKTGHWIKSSSWYECSECSLATDESGKNFYRYCPNCGCKMEG